MSMKPLTKNELREYFQVYRDAFPEWEADVPYSLSRTCGPITQVIGFQNLSYGAYRLMCGVEVSGPPDGGSFVLPQMLDVKHRNIERRQHLTKWPKVLRAIEEQIVPDVRMPLEIVEVFQLAEEEAERGANGRYLNGVAALSVYVGQYDRAIEWCNQAEASFSEFEKAIPCPEWMLIQRDFTNRLREAIKNGTGLEFLAITSDQRQS
ncbi:MAG: hypothetical protein SFX18_01150 [Pirellulales bacterium]|nr:hypothetical protein [Pirellulales bacterium]